MADSELIANNTIKISVIHPEQYDEGVNATGVADIYPGMLVSLYPGLATTLDKLPYTRNTGNNLVNEVIFVTENVYWGKSITDAYTLGEFLPLVHPRKGDIILSKVTAMESTVLQIGSLLAPNFTDSWLAEIKGTNPDFTPDSQPWPIGVSLEYDATPSLPRWTAVRIL